MIAKAFTGHVTQPRDGQRLVFCGSNSVHMTRNDTLAPVQSLRGPSTRLTRSASALSKPVEPDSAVDSPAAERVQVDRPTRSESDEDAAQDEVVLAELPSQSHDSALSSQARRQLAKAGSSAFDERDSQMDDHDEEAYDSEAEHDDDMYDDEDNGADVQMRDEQDELVDEEDEESADDSDVENDSRSEGEIESIRHEIDGVEDAVPALADKYQLIDRLGEGAACPAATQASVVAVPLIHVLRLRHVLLRLQSDRSAAPRLRQLSVAPNVAQGQGVRRRQADLRDEQPDPDPERARVDA